LLNQPLGTILGIFTLIVLARPSVKVLFQGSAAPTSPTRFPASIGPGGSPFDA
jgi:hypothetical protein